MIMLPDAYDLWREHDDRQQARLAKLPECFCCGERIQQETAVYMFGKWFCDYCLDDNRRDTEQEE